MKINFTPEKIARMESKAREMSVKELQQAYTNNADEIDRCINTNAIINKILRQKIEEMKVQEK